MLKVNADNYDSMIEQNIYAVDIALAVHVPFTALRVFYGAAQEEDWGR